MTGNVTAWAVFGGLPANVMDYTTPQSGCTYYANSQPHAVRGDTDGSTSYSYCYDANGNMLSSTTPQHPTWDASYTWTSYNLPDYFNNGSFGNSQFYYNADHQRYKQVANGYPDSPETTYYVGGLMQKVVTPAATTYRHLIPVGSSTVMVSRLSTGTNPVYYITKDHLGSTSVISDVNGALVLSENFSPTGIERSSNWAAFGGDSGQSGTTFITHQAFTGQEMDDNLSMVNLNGRMLISSGGRMLSPDPYVPDPGNTQSFNRYSYVNNNPLSLVDPTGFDDDPLDEITVTAQAIYDVADGLFTGIGSFFGFGGGGSKLTPSQRLALSHGVNLSKTLPSITEGFGQNTLYDPEIQAAAADYYGVDPNHFENYALGSAPTGPPVDGVPQIDGVTVYGHVYYGFNYAPLGAAIVPYDPGHAALQTVQVGINGALGLRGALNLYGFARAAFGARGVGLAGSFSSVTNSVGGRVYTSVGEINQYNFRGIVTSELYNGKVIILSGVDGFADGSWIAASDLFEADVATFGGSPGVSVYNIAAMSDAEISAVLNGEATVIGGFCNSGACLAPFW